MSDWTTDAADAVERLVTTARDKTVVPARAVAKGLVYGLLTAFLVGAALTLVAIALFRALSILLPVWAAWLVLGGIFVLAGAFCWTRRSVSADSSEPST